MTIQQLLINLLNTLVDLDKPAEVKICLRDENDVVTHVGFAPITRVDSHDHVCIEHSQIKWKTYE